MLGRIRRQSRRLTFTVLLMVAWVFLYDALQPEHVWWLRSPLGVVLMVLAVLIMVGAPLLVLTLAVPMGMPNLELFAITAILALPIERGMDAMGLPDWTEWLAFIALFVAVGEVLYDEWQPSKPLVNLGPSRRTFWITATPEEVWRALLPDPTHSGNYYRAGGTFLPAPEGSGADFVHILPRRGGYKEDSGLVFVETAEPFRRFAYLTQSVSAASASSRRTETIGVEIAPERDGRTRVEVTTMFFGVTPGRWLFLYLNHAPADLAACLQARLDGRRDWSLLGRQLPRRAA